MAETRAPAPPASADPPTPLYVAPLVAIAAFMEVLDLSIANVALRHIAGDLSAGLEESTWILTSYLITNAIVLPLSGWLSLTMGRKRFFLTCVAGFGVSSLLCGMAPNLATLIIARAIQGLTGGGLQPSSQSILMDSFPPHKRGTAFAIFGMAVVFAPAIGPTLGGWITDNFSWRWVFLINVPISAVLFFLIQAVVRDPSYLTAAGAARRKAGFRIDYFGFGLLAAGLGLLQFVFDRGEHDDWFNSGVIVAAAAVSVTALAVFVIRMLSHKDPLVDFSLMRNPNFAVSSLLLFILGFVLMGSTALLPQYVQVIQGYNATDAGMVLSPGGFLIMFVMPLMARIGPRFDARLLIGVGLFVCGTGLYLMSGFNGDVDYVSVALARCVQTLGLPFLFIPINTAAYAEVPLAKTNAAAALLNLWRNLGGSVGIAVSTTLVAQRTQVHHADLATNISVYAQPYLDMVASLQHRIIQDGFSTADALLRAQQQVANLVNRQAQLLAYVDDFLFQAVVCVVLIPLLFVMRRPPSARGPSGGH